MNYYHNNDFLEDVFQKESLINFSKKKVKLKLTEYSSVRVVKLYFTNFQQHHRKAQKLSSLLGDTEKLRKIKQEIFLFLTKHILE